MATKLVMIHGRNQASDEHTAADANLLDSFITQKRLQFLAGLAKGLVLAQQPPIDAKDVIFPFYGNVFARKIAEFEGGGGTVPALERVGDAGLESTGADPGLELSRLQGEMLEDMAERLNYQEHAANGADVPEAGLESLTDFLRVPVVTRALQFLSRKTGVPGFIIRERLADVAYYIGNETMRQTVLDTVREEIRKHSKPGDKLVVIGHSLGSVVAYDLLAANDETIRDRKILLLVTAGCPLGLKVVKKRVLGRTDGEANPAVPAVLPKRRGAWINAYDVLDVVALIHPLAPEFVQSADKQLIDERTNNVTGPHDIIDYLADPDVAAPISRAVLGV